MSLDYLPANTSPEDRALAERIEAVHGGHVNRTWLAWREAVHCWGVRSPGAMGWLLALVREKAEVPSLQCGHVGGWGKAWNLWEVTNPPGRGHGCRGHSRMPTEIEALVAALEEAAP